ncbi:MAG: RNA polymerase sigma factor [Candidatus Krumholzibacteriia bacterium]
MDVAERALVAGLQAKETWARRVFFERAHDAVYAHACRLTRDVDLRRDWTHDVLLRLVEDVAVGRFEYRRPGSFWAWFRIRTPYLLLDCLRAWRRLVSHELPAHDDAGGVPHRGDPPAPDDPSSDLESLEIAVAVAVCLGGLANLDQRQALTLLLYEELSYEEIATALGRPLNTVRTDIRRGRLALRECLARQLELDG